MSSEVDRLAAEVARLTAQVEALTAALAKDVANPFGPQVIIHEKRGFTYGINPAEPRRVIDYRSHNKTAKTIVSADGFTIGQLERAARKFARLEAPARKHWTGKKELYGLMRHLFAQHAAIVRHHGGRTWSWSIWPHQRREIAAKIISTLTRPT